ncbi:MAG: glycosyltransferase family 4 protein [Flavipsychrobacter sp.]
MSKRIGIVLNNVPSYSETFFHNKINGLIEKGFDVILFAEKNGNPFPAGWTVVSPYALPAKKLFRSLCLAAILAKLILRVPNKVKRFYKLEKGDGLSNKKILENIYINAHLLPYKLDWLHFGFATVALRRENVAKTIGAKMAISFRGYDIGIYPLKHPGCYKRVWSKTDKVHTISTDLLDKAYKLGLPHDKPVSKITPAIKAEQFMVSQENQTGGAINILTVARLNWKKGILYALHAIKELKDKGFNIQYTIIGDGEDKERLLFAVHQLGLINNVVFKGKVKSNMIPEYFKKHTIYLQPSVQEGFCNAVLEAQAGGLLCIVTDAEGLQENVLHNKTGWVVKRRNVKGITDAITQVIDMDESSKAEIRNSARERIEKEFTLEKQIAAFADFYQ